MTLTDQVVKNIITKLLKNEHYGVEISNLLNAKFMAYAVDFFKKVATAKLNNQQISGDWYKKEMLNQCLSKTEMAINSGTNEKTITNIYNTSRKEVVLDASLMHYDKLLELISNLVDENSDINLILTIKLNGVAIDLDVNESLIVISSLAAKRDAMNGGLWSTAGKKVEKPLMLTLCKLYNVDPEYYAMTLKTKKNKSKAKVNINIDTDFEREIDFYLFNNGNQYKCEVKLMSKGNPESADAAIARGSKVFVANKLSDTNKKQFNSLGIQWVELRDKDGYKRFGLALEKLNIPHTDYNGDLDVDLPKILDELF